MAWDLFPPRVKNWKSLQHEFRQPHSTQVSWMCLTHQTGRKHIFSGSLAGTAHLMVTWMDLGNHWLACWLPLRLKSNVTGRIWTFTELGQTCNDSDAPSYIWNRSGKIFVFLNLLWFADTLRSEKINIVLIITWKFPLDVCNKNSQFVALNIVLHSLM
jgi:hypothetical protein